MKLKGKRVLVTGGNGYLGRYLIPALLEQQAIVSVISRRGAASVNSYAVDINDKPTLEKAINEIQPQVIFHLAASLNRDRNLEVHDEIMRTNYHGTVNLLQALKDIPYEHFIFASSSEIYGNNKAPFKENQLPQPASPYSLSKVCAENAIATFSTIYKKKYSILRVFNFFGKDMQTGFFIPQMVESFKNGTDFRMTKGEQTRDFLYVDDVVQSLLLTACNKKAYNKIFNVCSNKANLLKTLVKEVHDQMNTKSKIIFGALPYRDNEVWNMLGSNKKIVKELGFKVNYPLKKAVKALLK